LKSHFLSSLSEEKNPVGNFSSGIFCPFVGGIGEPEGIRNANFLTPASLYSGEIFFVLDGPINSSLG
jgi:hypothetical protein